MDMYEEFELLNKVVKILNDKEEGESCDRLKDFLSNEENIYNVFELLIDIMNELEIIKNSTE